MTPFLLALKRLYRRPGFFALLLLFPLCMAGVSLLLPAQSAALPPAGIFCQDAQNRTSAFIRQLCGQTGDFVFAGDEQALRQGVSNGSFDCGFLLSGDTEAFFAGETSNASVCLLTSPVSLRAEIFRQRFSAALISQLSPQLCRELLEKYDIAVTAEELSRLMKTHAARENRFRIRLETVSGTPAVTDTALLANRSFLWGIVSLFLFACAAACAPLYAPAHLSSLRRVVPEKALWRYAVFPGLAAQSLYMGVSCALGYGLATVCGASFTAEEWLIALCYTIFLTGLTPVFSALFSQGLGALRLVPPVLCLSLFLCPILMDLPARFPALGFVAALLPPNVFFYFMHTGALWALLCAAAFLPVGSALLKIRLYSLQKSGAESSF